MNVGGSIVTAARVSWKMHRGAIPSGQQALRKCSEPSCVKPAHLFLGTQSDHVRNNIAKGLVDTSKLGRILRADDRRLKLTKSHVDEVRRLYAAGGVSHQALGDRFGVTKTNIGYIVRGQSRRHP